MDIPRLRLRRSGDAAPATEPPFDPTSWSGALLVMVGVAALLWALEIVDRTGDRHWDLRFGLKPRQVDGLWGIVTQPFLHSSYSHLFSNTVPLIGVGWVLLLSGGRVWLFVTAFVVVAGGLATWLVAPSGVVVGASALVFGWMGYLLARAYFSRRLKWILTAVAVLIFFGTLLGNLLPSVDARVSWQSHLCGFLAGVVVGWLLHPRRPAQQRRTAR
jgi:membrane associated rhomboid family serine protease